MLLSGACITEVMYLDDNVTVRCVYYRSYVPGSWIIMLLSGGCVAELFYSTVCVSFKNDRAQDTRMILRQKG